MTSTRSRDPAAVARYGAFELQRLAHRYLFIALGISIAIHVVVIGLCVLLTKLDHSPSPFAEGTQRARIIDLTPPSIAWPVLPGARIAVPQAPGKKFGLPVPVPEPKAAPNADLPTQGELSRTGTSTGEGEGEVIGSITTTATESEEAPPPQFVPVEKMPVIIHSGVPEYPPLAARADIEGRVIVSVWVDKTGKPKQVLIASSTNDIFNEAALAAARQYLFVPAYMNAGPVSVWVTLAFNFRLR
jgi:protein TonB